MASKSNDQFTSAGPLIQDATRTGAPPIEWHALLHSPSLPQFTKDEDYHISNLASFKYWSDLAADLGKDIMYTGLQLKMEAPGIIKTEAEAQNHLMIVEAA